MCITRIKRAKPQTIKHTSWKNMHMFEHLLLAPGASKIQPLEEYERRPRPRTSMLSTSHRILSATARAANETSTVQLSILMCINVWCVHIMCKICIGLKHKNLYAIYNIHMYRARPQKNHKKAHPIPLSRWYATRPQPQPDGPAAGEAGEGGGPEDEEEDEALSEPLSSSCSAFSSFLGAFARSGGKQSRHLASTFAKSGRVWPWSMYLL
jgi:hypothetical protein